MHDEILTDAQKNIVPLVKRFTRRFGLVGGTAIALHIGHRRSLDFDLFAEKHFENAPIKKMISDRHAIERELVNKRGEFTLFIRGVKITFYHYPFAIPYTERFSETIRIPGLLTLAAMKAYALGQRAKWKDYVDLYFIMKQYFSIGDIIAKTHELFGPEFNDKIFRAQLSYFNDINYAETVDYLPGFEVSDDEVKQKLIEFSLS